jgi:sialidase-1
VSVVLARSGEPSPGSPFPAPCYRIPALAVTASGRLIAAWDVRADWRDLPGPFDVVVRSSDDHGRTWTPPRALRAHEGGAGFGDASLIATASGRVLCWYVGSTGESFFSARPGGPGLALWLAASDDDGLTWTHRDLSALRPAGVGGMFATSGNGVQLGFGDHAGRLLQPFVLRRPGNEPGVTRHELDAAAHFAALASSDDDGETWALGAEIGPDCDESKVAETASGGVLLHARAHPRRRWARSSDGGESFGTPAPHPALVDPGCNGGLCRWGEMLICSLLDDERDRRRLVLRVSFDDGASWSDAVAVDSGAAGYSVLAPLADGALGLLYEAGDYAELVFRRITRAGLGLDGCGPTLVARYGTGRAKAPEVAS